MKGLTLTTLTKAKFLETTKQRVELLPNVKGFGDVWIRSVGEVKRSRRVSQLFDSSGNRIPDASARRRLHEVVDQVCVDEKGTPMFEESDIPTLEEIDSAKLDPLYLAIGLFNGDSEKNGQAASVDTNEN